VRKSMNNLNRYLDQIVANIPGVLEVGFDDLRGEEACKRVFERCLPYDHNHGWWEAFDRANLQINTRALMRYRFAHRPQIDAFKSACKAELRRLAKAGAFVHE